MIKRGKNLLGTCAAALLLMLSACGEENDNTPELVVLDEATAEAVVDFTNDDINNIVLNNMDALLQGGRGEANGTENFNPYRGRDNCADVTHDADAQTITIDFGEGCISGDDLTRSGAIIIHYTDRRNVAGAVITTTFENYFVNGNQVEGTRVLENTSDGTANQRAFSVTVTGGQITFEDGTTRTFQGTHTRTHTLEETSNELTVMVTGSRSGTNREGTAFSMNITSPLVFTYSCRQVGVRLAVSGTRELTRDGATLGIDYGDGTCDNEVTVTRPDGTSEVIQVSNRRRRG